MSIGRQIARLRTEAGMSQSELARRVSCTQSMISMIEGGSCGSSLTMLQCIADALGESLIIHPIFMGEE
jgi:transcriptional regulator with XRE-family HTH domain